MNDDFKEDYEEQESSAWDDVKEAKNKYDDIEDKYKRLTKDKNSKSQKISDQVKEANDYRKKIQDKSMARARNSISKAGTNAAKTGANAAGTAGATGATGATAAAGTAGATTAAGTAGATTAAGTAGATTAAGTAGATTAAGTAGATTAAGTTTVVGATTALDTAAVVGTVGVEAMIPYVGWMLLIIEAIIALLVLAYKLMKKHDKKMAENGVDSKGIRRLFLAAPLVLPIAIFALILILFISAETTDKMVFTENAMSCFSESSMASTEACKDFMGTGVRLGAKTRYDNGIDINGYKPLIERTDIEIANMVVRYMTAYKKYFKNEDSFITDLVDEINKVGREGLDDPKKESVIQKLFEDLVTDGIIGDVRLAWNMFNWMKLERKVYQNIEWRKTYNATAVEAFSVLSAKVGTMLSDEPTVIMGETSEVVSIPADLDFSNAYLPTPLSLTFDEAYDIVKEYIPSWLEVYGTYIMTEDYDLANGLYKYYLDKDKHPIEVTLHQLVTVTRTKHVINESAGEFTKYYIKKSGEKQIETDKAGYEAELEATKEGGIFAWIADLISDIVSEVKELLDKAVETLKSFFGWYIDVESNYIPVVTKGRAYTYEIEQTTSIGVNETEEYILKASTKQVSSDTITKEKDETSIKFWTKTYMYLDYDIKKWSNVIQLTDSKIRKYDEINRYVQTLSEVMKADGDKYTIDDVAIVADLINNYYSEEYGIGTNFVVTEIVPGGDLNTSVVNFAKQFEGKNLAFMKGIDDTNTFWNADWCAMFVSYCMKKAGLGVIDFTGCTTFRRNYNQKVGFVDNPTRAQLKSLQVGDIILFRWAGEPYTKRNHTALVYSIEKDSSGNVTSVQTIDGNVGSGGFGNTKVTICNRSLDTIASYISISTVKNSVDTYGYWRNR